MSVNHSARSGGIYKDINRDIISLFYNKKVYCVFSLESPHRGDSNEYTQHTIYNIKRKPLELIPNTIMSAGMGFLGT